MSANNRMNFISYAKCFAILLVCIGHFLPKGDGIKVLIYTFHVPIFFVISGFLFKGGEQKPKFGAYFLSRLKRLLVPYVIFYWASCIWYIFNPVGKPNLLRTFLFLDSRMIWNDPLWFIPTMFIASMIFYFFVSEKGSSTVSVAFLTALCFALTVFLNFNKIRISFFGLDKAIHMCGYIGVGFLLRQLFDSIRERLERNALKVSLFFSGLFAAFCAVAMAVNGKNRISILYDDYNNIVIYIILAILGSVFCMLMFFALPRLPLAEVVANNTLFIMSAHYFIWRPFKELILPINSSLYVRYAGALLCCVLMVLSVWIYGYICRKYNARRVARVGEYLGLSAK